MEPKTAKIHTDPNSQTFPKEALFTVPVRFSSYTVLEIKYLLMHFPDFGLCLACYEIKEYSKDFSILQISGDPHFIHSHKQSWVFFYQK